jgi:hypothetical protein
LHTDHVTTWTNYYDGPIRNDHIYDTLFCSRCRGLLYLSPATASKLYNCAPPKPNRHILTFLHPILLCRITYWAPLEMFPPSSTQYIVRCKVLECFGIVWSQSDIWSEFENFALFFLPFKVQTKLIKWKVVFALKGQTQPKTMDSSGVKKQQQERERDTKDKRSAPK